MRIAPVPSRLVESFATACCGSMRIKKNHTVNELKTFYCLGGLCKNDDLSFTHFFS